MAHMRGANIVHTIVYDRVDCSHRIHEKGLPMTENEQDI